MTKERAKSAWLSDDRGGSRTHDLRIKSPFPITVQHPKPRATAGRTARYLTAPMATYGAAVPVLVPVPNTARIQDALSPDAVVPLFGDAAVIFGALFVALLIACVVEIVIRWRRGR